MRIASTTFYQGSLSSILDNQSSIARLNQQIAADQRILAPKDDPLATEKILGLSTRVAARAQFVNNQDRALFALSYESTVLQELDKTLNDARAVLVGMGDSFDQTILDSGAQELQSLAQHILDLANTRDPGGNYIFGGFDTVNEPYANPLDGTTSATTYGGTPNPGGTRAIEVEVSRQIQVNDNLDSVMQSGVAGSDLLQELDDAIATLQGGVLDQADIDGWLAVIDDAIANLDLINHRVAAAYAEVEDVQETTKSLLTQEQNALSDLLLLDETSAIAELQSRMTSLEAAQQAFGMTSSLSLFNYIG
ncbi:MAG: flagellar hook-associated protein FlgL [Pseudomonadota bacterium]